MLGIVVAFVLGEAVVVGFLLITNSVKEDQIMVFKFIPILHVIALHWLILSLMLLTTRQFDLTTFSKP